MLESKQHFRPNFYSFGEIKMEGGGGGGGGRWMRASRSPPLDLPLICYVIYQTRGRVFDQGIQRYPSALKNEAQPCFFYNPLREYDLTRRIPGNV